MATTLQVAVRKAKPDAAELPGQKKTRPNLSRRRSTECFNASKVFATSPAKIKTSLRNLGFPTSYTKFQVATHSGKEETSLAKTSPFKSVTCHILSSCSAGDNPSIHFMFSALSVCMSDSAHIRTSPSPSPSCDVLASFARTASFLSFLCFGPVALTMHKTQCHALNTKTFSKLRKWQLRADPALLGAVASAHRSSCDSGKASVRIVCS